MSAPVVLDLDLRVEAGRLPSEDQEVRALLWWGERLIGETTLAAGHGDWAQVRSRLLSEWRSVIDALDSVTAGERAVEYASADVTVVVVVTTGEEPGMLTGCLAALARLDPVPAEIIVVADAAVPRPSAQEGRLRYLVVPAGSGVASAREAGWRSAGTPVIAFTLDRARPHPRWVDALCRGFVAPSVACVTGLVVAAEFVTPAQRLFESTGGMARGFTPRLFCSKGPGPDTLHCGDGANMAFRRDALERIGGFDTRLSAGRRTRAGDDLDAFLRVMARGSVLAYRPDAVIRHVHDRDLLGLWRKYTDRGIHYAALLAKHVGSGDTAPGMARRELLRWHRDQHGRALLGAVRRRDVHRLGQVLLETAASGQGAARFHAEASRPRP
jgi:cellulose synthase/poly-beta-1,6-N-acetylglucosamine synthase-like glycosyltransferase